MRPAAFFYALNKYFNQFWAKIGTANLTQYGQRFNRAFMGLIRSIGGNGIKAIRDPDDLGAQGDLVAFESRRVTAAVHFFMMIKDVIDDRGRKIKIF